MRGCWKEDKILNGGKFSLGLVLEIILKQTV